MKALVIKVKKGVLYVKRELICSIDKGIALFLGVEKQDEEKDLLPLVNKLIHLRIFEDEKGKFNYSLQEKNLEVMCIPNFTLCANIKKGRRPSFEAAQEKEKAKELFQTFVSLLRSEEIKVKEGIFGAYMQIDLELDGPVNFIIDSREI